MDAAVQTSLFDIPEHGRARRGDPATSKAAAGAMRVADVEGLVLGALRRSPRGLTSHEAAELLGISLVSASPRFRPLVEKNLARDSGERRRGANGRSSIVWKAN